MRLGQRMEHDEWQRCGGTIMVASIFYDSHGLLFPFHFPLLSFAIGRVLVS